MSEAEITSFDTESALPAELPGQYLSRARAARGLSVADIAQTLKFSERQIEALERDDYQLLSGATFIRGFIRNYARILKIDPVPLIAMLEAGAPLAAVEVVAPDNMGDAVPRAFMQRYARLGGVAVVVLAISAVAYLWLPGFLNKEVIVTRTPQPAPGAGTIVDGGVEMAAPTVFTAPAANSQLVVDFDDRSWIEIKDATENVVLTGEFPGGFHQDIVGHAPFQLWIGNAAAVRVRQGNHAIDLLPHTREGVARLTVD